MECKGYEYMGGQFTDLAVECAKREWCRDFTEFYKGVATRSTAEDFHNIVDNPRLLEAALACGMVRKVPMPTWAERLALEVRSDGGVYLKDKVTDKVLVAFHNDRVLAPSFAKAGNSIGTFDNNGCLVVERG